MQTPPHSNLSLASGRGISRSVCCSPMSQTDIEIVVDDPTAPEDDSPSIVASGTIEIVVCLLLLALAITLGYDNWRTGASWDATGPEPGYFPFYLSVILGAGSLYGLISAFLARRSSRETFVTHAQARRVMAVFVPTLLFCVVTQFLGLYVASFLLIAGFMRLVGKIALWKSLLTAFVFTAIMFVTFDIAFDVIMPKGPLEAALGR
ncbi:tripartite tricarboxylate transporter TctB family protein [Bradyrhizobium vignae]|nr:tripartite tricarboxylate transporter TctB family protein [Bradyrhizobium vignae]